MARSKKQSLVTFSNEEGVTLPSDPIDFDDALIELQKISYDMADHDRTGSVDLYVVIDGKPVGTFNLTLPVTGKVEDVMSRILKSGEISPTPEVVSPEPVPNPPSAIKPSVTQPKRKQRIRKKARRENPKRRRLNLPRVSSRVVKLVAGALTVLVLTVGAVIGVSTIASRKPPVPSYTTLVKAGHYEKAAKIYPAKRDTIAARLTDRGDTKELKKFVSKFPTASRRFDLAFLTKDYKKVVKFGDDASMTTERRAKLAVAYVMLDQPDAAQAINAELGSKKLSVTIALGYIHDSRFDDAATLNDTFKSDVVAKAISIGKQYQSGIDKYQKIADDAKASATQRDTARQNIKTLKHQLKTLGQKEE